MDQQSNSYEMLYVSYIFPPLLGGGVARAEQNAKLLPQFGWRPTMLTITADQTEEIDGNFANIGVEILRANSIIKENKVRALPRGVGKKEVPKIVQTLRMAVPWLLMPDRQVLWKIPAQRLAMQAASKHNWKCVFGTLHPITSAWVAKNIASRLRLPFVLEYRDVIREDYKGLAPTALHRSVLRFIERSLVHSAAKIIVVSPGIKDWVVKRHNLDPKMVNVIPTGYLSEDKEFFTRLPKMKNDRFTMLYSGTFQGERRPDTILKAVRKIIDEKLIPAEKLRLVFIGNLSSTAISEYGLNNIAETIPMIPRIEVFKWMAQSDLLLLICDKCDYQNVTYPGKLFEYLMTEKPILGLLDKNSVSANFLEESGIGINTDADDVEETASKIKHIYHKWYNNKLLMQPNKDFIEQYNCNRLVNQLASTIEEAVAGKNFR